MPVLSSGWWRRSGPRGLAKRMPARSAPSPDRHVVRASRQYGIERRQCRLQVVALARVHRRCLDDGAARRGQPVEALAHRQPRDLARGGVARADPFDGRERAADHVQVSRRVQRLHARRVQPHRGLQPTAGRARQDYARVDELAPVHARHHAQHGVVIGVQRGHGRPPPRRRAVRATDRSARARRRRVGARRRACRRWARARRRARGPRPRRSLRA